VNGSESAGDMPLRYTKDHEWLRLDGDVATVGVTPFAQEKLGDLVFVELPGIGAKFERAAAAATVESVKAAAEVYAPVSGEIVAVNDKVVAEPGLVNSAPTGEGWLFKMKVANMAELDSLLDEEAYRAISK
jgi:glycine cleavage system H protein